MWNIIIHDPLRFESHRFRDPVQQQEPPQIVEVGLLVRVEGWAEGLICWKLQDLQRTGTVCLFTVLVFTCVFLVCLFVCFFVCWFVCLFVSLFVCLFVCEPMKLWTLETRMWESRKWRIGKCCRMLPVLGIRIYKDQDEFWGIKVFRKICYYKLSINHKNHLVLNKK